MNPFFLLHHRRSLPVCAILIFSVFCPHIAPAQPAEQIQIRNIGVDTVRTPDIQASGFTRRSPSPRDWLEIEVTFDVQLQTKFVDGDLVLRYYVYAQDVDQVLVGEVTHINVASGRDKISVMYVSPGSIAKLLDGASFNRSRFETVGVQVLFRGQTVAEQSTSVAPQGQWWQTRPQISGLLLDKSQTPFAHLAWERYEELKPAAR